MADDLPAWLPPLLAFTGRLAPGLAARAAAGLLTRPGGSNPPRPWELEPGTISPRRVELGGGLRALAWGETGEVVLAQHGWRGRPTQFCRLAAALVPRGYRLVALHGPGHGVTPGRRATPRVLADALCDAASELGGAHAVVGHSIGGAAAGVALEFGLPARRLVLVASPPRVSRMISGLAGRLGLPPAARRELDAWFDRHAGRPVAELDLVSLALPARVEALVVHDRDDEVIPVGEAERLESTWPQARFLYTHGLGHRDLLADADVVEAIADFVATGAPRQPAAVDAARPAGGNGA